MPINDNHAIDYHLLQSLHNGYTFVCILNESDIYQSNYLLNIRLEADNSTLFWSRPAWDIANTWTQALSTAVNMESSSSSNDSPGEPKYVVSNNGMATANGANGSSGAGGPNYARRESQFKSNLLNSSLLMTFDPSTARFPSKSENYLKKKLFTGGNNSNMKKSMAATSIRRKLTLPVNIYKGPSKGNGAGNGGDFGGQKSAKFSGKMKNEYEKYLMYFRVLFCEILIRVRNISKFYF